MTSPKPSRRSSGVSVEPRTPTPRKKPHCSQCGSPMLGHKRGQCRTQAPEGSPAAAPREGADIDLMRGMQSLRIERLDRGTEGPRKAQEETIKANRCLERAETLISLCSEDQAMLDVLSKPGIMADMSGEDNVQAPRVTVQQWLETVSSPNRRRSGIGFGKAAPRTTMDPSVDVSGGSSALGLRNLSRASTAKPLGKTSSMEERDQFLNALTEKSKAPVACVFTISMSDIHELESNAKRLKFHARVIAPKFADGATGDGWLVIGREGNSVDEIFREVEQDVKKSHNVAGVATQMGSGAVGAIVAWLYLAFS